jgi:hypothetical protein
MMGMPTAALATRCANTRQDVRFWPLRASTRP